MLCRGWAAWALARSQRPRAGSFATKASSVENNSAGKPITMNAVRQPYCSTTHAPRLRPMTAEKVGAAVKQLMANERRCGGYKSAMIDIDAEVVGDSLTATAMRATASIQKLTARPQIMVATAHNRQAIASKRVRDIRSANRPAGKARRA